MNLKTAFVVSLFPKDDAPAQKGVKAAPIRGQPVRYLIFMLNSTEK